MYIISKMNANHQLNKLIMMNWLKIKDQKVVRMGLELIEILEESLNTAVLENLAQLIIQLISQETTNLLAKESILIWCKYFRTGNIGPLVKQSIKTKLMLKILEFKKMMSYWVWIMPIIPIIM